MKTSSFIYPLTGMAALASLASCGSEKEAPKQYNIVYIMTDDHTAQMMSCYGSRFVETPNLDRIANDGVIFTNSFVANSLSGPSRACMLTGKHSHANGFTDNTTCVFDGSQQTMPKPSIKVVLDVHRDAIENDAGARMAPVVEINGRKAAQVMLICGCDNGSTVSLPNWRQNLRFAAAWESAMEGMYPGFTRPVLFSYRFYNQDLTTGSLLIEIGTHGNNLNEALYAGQLAANALVSLFGGAG